VQASLEQAILKLSGEVVTVTAAGRTDAGVHAYGQVAHADIVKVFSPDKLRDALNAHLRPHPVAVLQAEEAGEAFHARFDAIKRHYLYRIVNRRSPLTLDAGKAWLVQIELDAEAMHHAAQRLVGNHDFTTFRAAECQAKSPLKTLDVLRVSRAAVHQASARRSCIIRCGRW
jgi:tRNA pseudouridine38-40 synthase